MTVADSPPPLYRPRPRLELRPSGFLLDRSSGETFTLSETAQALFRAFVDGTPSDSLWQALTADFAVDEQVARRDAEAFLRQLKAAGLAREEPPPEPAAEPSLIDPGVQNA